MEQKRSKQILQRRISLDSIHTIQYLRRIRGLHASRRFCGSARPPASVEMLNDIRKSDGMWLTLLITHMVERKRAAVTAMNP